MLLFLPKPLVLHLLKNSKAFTESHKDLAILQTHRRFLCFMISFLALLSFSSFNISEK